MYGRRVTDTALAFGALAEPTRLRIVESLRPGERTVGALVASLGVCQPGISRHLRILLGAGFVRVRAEGQKRFYSLRREPFQALDTWMRDYRELIEARMDRLENLVGPSVPGPNSTRTRGRRDAV
jgi:DNA-binding transcriptional ArsR family regulator